MLYAAEGQLQSALVALQTALRNDPTHRAARENLGDVHLALAVQAWTAAQAGAKGDDAGLRRKLQLAREIQAVPLPTAAGAPGRARLAASITPRSNDVSSMQFALAAAGLVGPAADRRRHGAAWAQKVRLDTSMGEIVIQLDAAKAPKSVANFLDYVKAGHYDGTIFHRVIPNFMIQGGGFDAEMNQKPTRAPIPLESKNGLTNVRGSVAMARTNVPDSATAQFFINLKDNAFLDSANTPDGTGYAVFGKVVSGMDVVDKIWAVPTGNKGPHQNVPVTPVMIRKASVEN